MDYLEASTQALEFLKAGNPQEAFRVFRPMVGYPAVVEEAVWSESFSIFARIAGEISGPELETRLKACTSSATPEAFYDAAHALYEDELFDIAATLLTKANKATPGMEGIIIELSATLESMMRNDAAAAMLRDSGLVGRSPWATYLFAYNSIMTGTLLEGRKTLKAFPSTTDDNLLGACANLHTMLDRAEALKGHSPLDHEDLDGWHMMLNGGVLLHESIDGFSEAMRGRYAYVADRYELLRAGLDAVSGIAQAEGLVFPQVIAAPDRSSLILATAAAKHLGIACVPWTEGVTLPGLVVAYDLDTVNDVKFLGAMQQHEPGQVLWAHASCWTKPFAYTPDLTTFLYQVNATPWGDDGMRMDSESKETIPRQADNSPVEEIAQRILEAEPAPSHTEHNDLLALVHTARNTGLGLFTSGGPRARQQAGSPVLSNRFA